MITKWGYTNDREGYRNETKKLIADNNYKAIDIGAGLDYWSYPECKCSADSLSVGRENNTHFKLNLDKSREYVVIDQEFDFSICSHTLEDINNPFQLLDFIEQISPRGLIAVPSKYDEFSFLFGNNYRGNAHHKQFFDVINNELVLFPKYPFIEKRDEADWIRTMHQGKDLYLYWEGSIPRKYFGEGKIFMSDGDLIGTYFNELNRS